MSETKEQTCARLDFLANKAYPQYTWWRVSFFGDWAKASWGYRVKNSANGPEWINEEKSIFIMDHPKALEALEAMLEVLAGEP